MIIIICLPSLLIKVRCHAPKRVMRQARN